MMFICHSGSTVQYNTMQSNIKKDRKTERKKERKKENAFRHAYKSTKLVCDSSVIKINITYIVDVAYAFIIIIIIMFA